MLKNEDTDKSKKGSNKTIKNSILLIFIYIATIGMTFYFCKSYNVYKDYQKEIPVIRDSLQEITKEDLEHYIVENSVAIIYMCTAPDDTCRGFEKDLKKYIKKKEITDEIVYLNLTGVDLEQFVNNFNKKYPNKTKLTTNFPAFAYFNEGALDTILQSKKSNTLTVSKLNTFLELIWSEEEEEEETTEE